MTIDSNAKVRSTNFNSGRVACYANILTYFDVIGSYSADKKSAMISD